MADRRNIDDDPFMLVWRLCCNSNTAGAKYLQNVLNSGDIIGGDIIARNNRIRTRANTGTKFRTYVELNPNLTSHSMYDEHDIPEHYRLAATRLRLSSHNLAIETGRWSRTPPEARLCSCGSVQTEAHVLFHCNRTATYRINHSQLSFTNVASFFVNRDYLAMCRFIYLCCAEFA